MTAPLAYALNRSIYIAAPQSVVFSFFTDSSRWASWWGAGSSIDPRIGGQVLIKYPNAVEASGEVLEISAPERVVFTFGYASGAPIPVGSSRVTIALEAERGGTRVRLTHDLPDDASRDQHVQGWRYQLALFANAVSDLSHAGAVPLVDAWFEAWSEPDDRARAALLERITTHQVRMHDRFSCVEGQDDLSSHIAGSQRFMPGVRLTRRGDARQCQGTILVDWTATGADGQPRGQGSNVFTLAPTGRIESVTGFWV